MGVVINQETLRRELAARGWTGADLGRAANLSSPTVSAALTGRPVAPLTVIRIAKALEKTPPVDSVGRLLD